MKKYYLIWKKGENDDYTPYKWGEWSNGSIAFDEAGDYQVSYIEGWTTETSVQQRGESGDYIAVNLGLPSGNLWANKNVGSNGEMDSGMFFSWGDTAEKDVYTRESDKHNISSTVPKRYDSPYRGEQGIQGKEGWDAAHEILGGKWVMPTQNDTSELLLNCTWTLVNDDGLIGYRVKSKSNDNSIFLPITGYKSSEGWFEGKGHYWTSTLYLFPSDWDNAETAMEMVLSPQEPDVMQQYYLVNSARFRGYTIRPIQRGPNPPDYSRYFNIYPLFIESKEGGFINSLDFKTNKTYRLNGNHVFLGYVKKSDSLSLSDVVLTSNTSSLHVYPLDDYAFMFCKGYNSYNSWSTSISNANFNLEIPNVTAITVSVNTYTDEDNQTLGNGCYLNKLYKVSSEGGTIIAKTYLFPYSYSSIFYDENFIPKLFKLDWIHNGNPETGGTIESTVIDESTPVEGHMFNDLEISYNSLECEVKFTIPRNETDEWKDEVYVISAEDSDTIRPSGPLNTLVRIVQEPASTTRIYYGIAQGPLYTGEYEAHDDDLAQEEYIDRGWEPYSWKYMFNTLGSHNLIENSFVFTAEEGTTWDILIPADLSNKYDITTSNGALSENATRLEGSETWGGVQYLWFKPKARNTKFIFTKK